MGKIVSGIRKGMFLIGAVLCLYYTVTNIYDLNLTAKGTVYLVEEYTPVYYEALSDNVGLTTINGISNVFINMKSDGYTVYNAEITNSYVDASFIKEGFPSYRYYFTYPDGRLTFFSSEYENSFKGLSYIINKKE